MLTDKEVREKVGEFFAHELERQAGISVSKWNGESSISKAINDFRYFHERGFYAGIALALKAVAEDRIDIELLKVDLNEQAQKMKDEAKD